MFEDLFNIPTASETLVATSRRGRAPSLPADALIGMSCSLSNIERVVKGERLMGEVFLTKLIFTPKAQSRYRLEEGTKIAYYIRADAPDYLVMLINPDDYSIPCKIMKHAQGSKSLSVTDTRLAGNVFLTVPCEVVHEQKKGTMLTGIAIKLPPIFQPSAFLEGKMTAKGVEIAANNNCDVEDDVA